MKAKTFSDVRIKQTRLTPEQDEIFQRKLEARAQELGLGFLSQDNFIRWAVLNAPVTVKPKAMSEVKA